MLQASVKWVKGGCPVLGSLHWELTLVVQADDVFDVVQSPLELKFPISGLRRLLWWRGSRELTRARTFQKDSVFKVGWSVVGIDCPMAWCMRGLNTFLDPIVTLVKKEFVTPDFRISVSKQ